MKLLNNIDKRSKVISSIFCDLEEGDQHFKYIDLLRRDFYTPDVKFGKFFKRSGGISNVISRVLFYGHLSLSHTQCSRCCIFSICIKSVQYICYLMLEESDGCLSCGMNYCSESKMYIAPNIETLITHSIPARERALFGLDESHLSKVV